MIACIIFSEKRLINVINPPKLSRCRTKLSLGHLLAAIESQRKSDGWRWRWFRRRDVGWRQQCPVVRGHWCLSLVCCGRQLRPAPCTSSTCRRPRQPKTICQRQRSVAVLRRLTTFSGHDWIWLLRAWRLIEMILMMMMMMMMMQRIVGRTCRQSVSTSRYRLASSRHLRVTFHRQSRRRRAAVTVDDEDIGVDGVGAAAVNDVVDRVAVGVDQRPRRGTVDCRSAGRECRATCFPRTSRQDRVADSRPACSVCTRVDRAATSSRSYVASAPPTQTTAVGLSRSPVQTWSTRKRGRWSKCQWRWRANVHGVVVVAPTTTRRPTPEQRAPVDQRDDLRMPTSPAAVYRCANLRGCLNCLTLPPAAANSAARFHWCDCSQFVNSPTQFTKNKRRKTDGPVTEGECFLVTRVAVAWRNVIHVETAAWNSRNWVWSNGS